MFKIVTILFFLFSISNIHAKRFSLVVIDPGHGGKDPGAHWYNIYEKDIVLDIAKRVKKYLIYYRIPSILTRSSDISLSLDQRIKEANSTRNALFVSIHLNANKKTHIYGFETYYVSYEGAKLAKLINTYIDRISPMPNRGEIKNNNFKVLRKTNSVSVLCELGYLSNKKESKLLINRSYKNQLAKSIARAIAQYKITN